MIIPHPVVQLFTAIRTPSALDYLCRRRSIHHPSRCACPRAPRSGCVVGLKTPCACSHPPGGPGCHQVGMFQGVRACCLGRLLHLLQPHLFFNGPLTGSALAPRASHDESFARALSCWVSASCLLCVSVTHSLLTLSPSHPHSFPLNPPLTAPCLPSLTEQDHVTASSEGCSRMKTWPVVAGLCRPSWLNHKLAGSSSSGAWS